ncbi:MAG TPA: neutral/alkaline non-lysosomal ceramidase N-terminal domain-containing protein [Dehalococcoidia bacterium]|nr:neutral/alkaline non-lysosomal ceramidase N-terminal domain-containing protein [Dehalococcoidia bacterium]
MAAPPFLAGAAALPITPLPEHLEDRLYLGGYGGYLGRPAAAVHDDLFARALVLGDGETTIALIALDLVGMSNRHIARIRASVSRRLEIAEPAVLVACTHTHAGPDLQGLWGGVSRGYAAHVRRQAVRAALQAAADRREAELRAVTTRVRGRTVNRRGWPRTDEIMTVLQARDDHKDVIATLVNFACHPTVTQAANVDISRDFPGALVDSLESALGGVALFVNADEGDANPKAAGGFAEMQAFGEGLAEKAARALKRTVALERPLSLSGRYLDLPLASPRLRLPPGLVLQWMLAGVRGLAGLGALRWLAGRHAGRDRAFVFAGFGLIAEHPVIVRRGKPYVRTRVSRVRMGDGLEALAVPGEVLTRLGQPLRERLSAPATMLLGLTNDTLGYFIPEDEWMSGRNNSYEETVSLGPRAAASLERAAVALLGAG